MLSSALIRLTTAEPMTNAGNPVNPREIVGKGLSYFHLTKTNGRGNANHQPIAERRNVVPALVEGAR